MNYSSEQKSKNRVIVEKSSNNSERDSDYQDYSKAYLLKKLKNTASKVLRESNAKYDWSINGRKEQVFPQWNWKVWLILAGRGFGKTRTGAEAVRYLVSNGYRNIGLIGETAQDVRGVMLEGESGLLRVHPDHERPMYYPSRNLLLWKNGAKARIFSSENPDSLRGPQFDAVWIDELAKFRNAEECWRQIMMCLRLGNPKIIVTTTPKPIKILKDLMNRKDAHITRGSTFDNTKNLSNDFISMVSEAYENSTFGQQELHGEIIDEASAFWTEFYYCDSVPELEDIVVAVDPAVTNNKNSDETGIIVAGKAGSKFYVLEDLSTKAQVSDWIKIAIDAFFEYNASRLVVEVNQGGDFIKEFIREVNSSVRIEEVRASSSKECRAQPVAIMYQQGQVYHVKRFRELENQMLSFGCHNSSPDRVDALVWAISRLKKNMSQITQIF